MTIYAAPNATIEASLQAINSGGTGTYRISILDTPNGLVFLAPTTSGITERPAASGVYHWTGQGPAVLGTYTVVWDYGVSNNVIAVEELVVRGTPAPDAPATSAARRSNAFRRLMPERCEILRFQQIGTEDGTPITATAKIDSDVPCRVDMTKSSGTDTIRRVQSAAQGINYGLCVMVHDAPLRSGDRLRMTRGPRTTQVFQVDTCEVVLAFDKPHHLEAEIRLLEGAI